MRVKLYHRHLGVHSPLREAEITGKFSDYVKEDGSVEEEKLLEALPEHFLKSSPGKTLLTVEFGDLNGSEGRSDLRIFMSWAKYFNVYVLELCRE